jgi:uncharacterized membrane protein YhaH (DUF805 family)
MLRYLFSFRGRLNRAKHLRFILISVLFAFAGAGIWMCELYDVPDAVNELGWEALLPMLFEPLPHLIATAALAALVTIWVYAALAVAVKRLHDRNRGAGWLLVFWIQPLVLQAAGFGFGQELATVAGDAGCNDVIVRAFILAAAFVFVWGFVELFLLPGTSGENRFGPDPRERTPKEPRQTFVPVD